MRPPSAGCADALQSWATVPIDQETVELDGEPGPGALRLVAGQGRRRQPMAAIEREGELLLEVRLRQRRRRHAGVPDERGEPQLVSIHVLAPGRIPRNDDGDQSGGPRVRDRAGTGMAHHRVGTPEQVHEFGMGKVGASLGDERSPARPVLDDEVDVGVDEGGGVRPVDEPIEAVVVGADEAEDERAHSKGPTRSASG